jgi:hypothetical protein
LKIKVKFFQIHYLKIIIIKKNHEKWM